MANVKDALDLTTRTIDRRAYRYRNLVVLVVLVGLGSVIGAVVLLSGLPLLGLLLLLPLCGGFHYLDSVLVNRWGNRLLQMWAEEELDLDVFVESIAAIRLLPPATLGAMLDTLPKIGGRELSPVVKKALVITLATRARCLSDRTAAGVMAYTCVAAAAAVSFLEGSWMMLTWILMVAPVLAGAWCVHAVRWRSLRRALLAMQRRRELDFARFFQVIDDLQTVGIPAATRRRLLDAQRIAP